MSNPSPDPGAVGPTCQNCGLPVYDHWAHWNGEGYNCEAPKADEQPGAVGTPERIAASAYFDKGRCSGHHQFNGRYCRDVAPPEQWCIHCAGFKLLDQVAALSASLAEKDSALVEWRQWAQFVFRNGGPAVGTDSELRTAVCDSYDAEVSGLERERDAAQQQCADAERFGNKQEQRAIKAESDLAASRAEVQKVIAHAKSYATDYPEAHGGIGGIVWGLDDVTDPAEFLAGVINNLVCSLSNERAEGERLRQALAELVAETERCDVPGLYGVSVFDDVYLRAKATLASTPQASEQDALVSDRADQAKG
jgi:hypothetical protein